jgi:hypothetical protein
MQMRFFPSRLEIAGVRLLEWKLSDGCRVPDCEQTAHSTVNESL